MLALAPSQVRLEASAAGDVRPLREILPDLMSRGVRAVSPNGVLGDPTGASAEEGRRLVERLVSGLRATVEGLVGRW
jgi:creatinine amidohydrolase